MNFYKKTANALFFSSIDEISEEIWTSLDCEQNLYFHRNFLKSIEKNHPEIKFLYIVLIDKNKKPKAFASIQIINFYFENVQNELKFHLQKLRSFGQKIYLLPKKKPLQLLICGNTFVSGEHGLFIHQHQDKKKSINEMAQAILHFVDLDVSLKIDAFLFKDFINESLSITDELKKYNYHPFLVEPNMVLNLHENWRNFDDYLASMKTKFRVKAKKALQLSAAIKIEEVILRNIETQLPKMTALYQKVATKANFNLGDFNLATYQDLKENFGDQYILKTYWLQGEIVGFMSGLINENSLDAHFVGIDYNLNREHAIYQRMLYDYIEIAIKKNLKTINFGRTASEIKSSVGATPQDLTMYVRHKKSITNRILKLFLQRVQPTSFQQKFPFKN
ncbi:GNAT family N-acetyltransferase [Polaribacter litorisediminis]|uniref:peptidogalycan biosysnthesis protein n=1 Tax=Polaribacter litorisediminis TaxID=1908341 RepID=UPI001CBFBD60|nr:GNAT family N-acetyltransferase [Polaribacter litorisediminis]UAM98199.1 GNAT family N-acetyltransferase [Polaribacter litorisediminis]